MHFDWYSATVRHHPEAVIAALRDTLDGRVPVSDVTRHPGTQGYAFEDRLVDPDGDRVCGVLSGGHNSLPHVRSSGRYSEVVAGALRSVYPDHSVSRADVAIDFQDRNSWNILRGACEDVATSRGLQWSVLGDDRPEGIRDPSKGRTFYVGSRQSQTFVRGYEKGIHEISKGVVARPGIPSPSPDWVRVEIEVKPKTSDFRRRAASLAPVDFWGCSVASRDILSRILSVDVERITMTEHKTSDAERTMRHIAIQYRRIFETIIASNGGDKEAIMDFVSAVWADMDNQKKVA